MNKVLKEHIVRSGKAALSAQAITFVLSMVSTSILARLISPKDFGLIAMVTAVTALVTIFQDGGLSIATIQRETVSQEQASNLFWINIVVSILLAMLLAAIAPAVAWFYGKTKLQEITVAIACIFFVGGMSVQHKALLRRQMRFAVIAKIQITSILISSVCAISFAWAGAGFWALIIQTAMMEVVTTVMSLLYCRWMPSLPKLGQGTLSMVRVGGHVSLLGLFNYLGRNLDNVLVGHYWGSHSLGSYSKAYGLLMLPIQQISAPISAVALPALSRLQSYPQEYRAVFRKMISTSCIISFPIITWMIICHKVIILVLLGSQWTETASIFLALSVAAFCQPVGNMSSLLYLSLGRSKKYLIWGIIGNIWVVTGILIGIPHGMIGVALGYSISTVLMMIPLMLFSISGTYVCLSDYLGPLTIPSIAAMLAGLVGWLVDHFLLTQAMPVLKLAVGGLSVGMIYFIFLHMARPQLLVGAWNILLKEQNAC
jgi:O-antigen/teichoic acid export membrane protein